MTAGSCLDRRQARRVFDPLEHGIRSVRIRPGHTAAAVVDVSAAGALLETGHRLLPGTFVELHVETEHHRTRVRGRVVRCAVFSVKAATVCYRGGIAFDRELPWFVREEGYGIHGAEHRESHRGRADATHIVV